MSPNRLRRPFARALSAVLALTGLGQAGAAQVQEDRYTILRSGSEVGVHEVRRQVVGGETRVRSESRIDVRRLGIDLYRFRYSADEVWDQAGLVRLEVRVDDDGKSFRLDGKRSGERFAWSSNAGTGEHALPLYPTNHWNPGVLGQDLVLNTLTGGLNRVDIERSGRESLALPGGEVRAQRYRYLGDLELDSWYDDRGRWLGMRFKGRDDSEIRYLCATCGPEATL
jgi:hypothetical protein